MVWMGRGSGLIRKTPPLPALAARPVLPYSNPWSASRSSPYSSSSDRPPARPAPPPEAPMRWVSGLAPALVHGWGHGARLKTAIRQSTMVFMTPRCPSAPRISRTCVSHQQCCVHHQPDYSMFRISPSAHTKVRSSVRSDTDQAAGSGLYPMKVSAQRSRCKERPIKPISCHWRTRGQDRVSSQ